MPYVLWLGLFVIAPIILITINAFKGDDGFTLKNFQQFLLMELFENDAKFILVCIFNYLNYLVNFLSDCIYFKSNENQQFWLLLIILPTWINLLLKAYAFIGIFGKHGLLNNF